MRLKDSELLQIGQRVLRLEAAEISSAAQRLDPAFARAVRLLADAPGRVIVSGVGKSGLIARKIAATLTSTGTPASYLHPVDSLHGDLGIVGKDDVAIVLSNSGESEDLFALLGPLQRLSVSVIAITGSLDSALARLATVVLDGGVSEEAGPHAVAPTTSTSVALALGDALAIALLEEKGFHGEEFAKLFAERHPKGSLGLRLLLRVRDVMLPPGRLLRSEAPMKDAVVTLAHDRGLAMVADNGHLTGVLTTGDLTRLAERDPRFLECPVGNVMNRSPKTAAPDDLAAAAVGLMQRHGVIVLPVVENGAVIGVVHLHDLMRAGAV
ncbi:MAG TPA: KpsF/GutQ family sugar-phosphate isomerase [Gemmatimonadales bacterium]|nr:KpsF/GutQ family sugar-phosphate isomerase [Gemmatimonadales bacterium]